MKLNKRVTATLACSLLTTFALAPTAQAVPKFLNIYKNHQGNWQGGLNINHSGASASSSTSNVLRFNDKNDNKGPNYAYAPGGIGVVVVKIPIAGEIDNEYVPQSNSSSASSSASNTNGQGNTGGMQMNHAGGANAINNDIKPGSEDVINQNCQYCFGNFIHKAYMGNYKRINAKKAFKNANIAIDHSIATDNGTVSVGEHVEED